MAINDSAKMALAATDRTMFRIQDAVSAGLTTWTTADVVAWTTYRLALRALITQPGQLLPSQPPYPANT